MLPKKPLFNFGLISVQYEIYQSIILNSITPVLLTFCINVSFRGEAIGIMPKKPLFNFGLI